LEAYFTGFGEREGSDSFEMFWTNYYSWEVLAESFTWLIEGKVYCFI